MSSPCITIIVPIYNEAQNLPPLIHRINPIADQISQEYGLSVNYVFIDDGSRDGSFEVLAGLDYRGRHVRLLELSRNFGKEAALSAGIEASIDAEAVIMMDADLQHPPELLLDMVRIWRTEKVDSVYTYKTNRRTSEGWLKSTLTRMFYWIMNRGSRFRITKDAGDFRLISRRFADTLRNLPESERFMKGLYGWIGFPQHGIPLTPPPRQHGSSSFNTMRLLDFSFNAITSFTTAPLRIMALSGFCIALLSGLYILYIAIERIFFISGGIGTSSILALIAFFGGMQMLFLGILGEYIGKTVLESKRRPPYILARDLTLGGPEATDGTASRPDQGSS